MSDIHARGLASSYAAGRARVRQINEDNRRMDFLAVLWDAKIALTPWEEQFVWNLVSERRPLTDGQRASADELKQKYGARVGRVQTLSPRPDVKASAVASRPASGTQPPTSGPAILSKKS